MMATRYKVSCDDCPFENTYRTRAQAGYYFSKHSCEKARRDAAKVEMRKKREASIDRTPKPCAHSQTQHQHGTYACYTLDHCRCMPCATANSTYEQERTRQQAYGRWNGLVDAEPARTHIRSLTEQGMGLKRIIAVSGLAQGTLWKLMYGKRRPDGEQVPTKRIRPAVEARVLAVHLDLAPAALVDGAGATRRIQALIALGWSQSKLAVRLGMMPSNFTGIVHGRRDRITAATDRAARALYGQLSMQLPPQQSHREKISVSRSKSYAARFGWLPPLAWDDDALDNPTAGPTVVDDAAAEVDEAAMYRRAHGDRVPLTADEKRELVRRLVADGWSQRRIEQQTGLQQINRYLQPRRTEVA